MKRKGLICIALAFALLFAAESVALAEGQEAQNETPPEVQKIAVELLITDEEEQPLADTGVLLQKELDSDYAYEGKTDADGKIVFPEFPLTGFILTIKNMDGEITGMADITLYPGEQTEILNKPNTGVDPLSINELKQTALARNAGVPAATVVGAGPASLPMNVYEVQVNQKAPSVAFAFSLWNDNSVVLNNVEDGPKPQPVPSPTLPPPSDPATTEPMQTETPTTVPTAVPTAAPTTAPTVDPTAAPTAVPTQAPTIAPTTAPEPVPTAQPTTAPEPTPAPTTPRAKINMKIYLMDENGVALPHYITTLNNETQSIANGDGEAYFAGIEAKSVDTLKVFTPDKKQIGVCNVQFIEGSGTGIAAVGTGGIYTINYQQGTQDVYLGTDVNKTGDQDTFLKLTRAAAAPMQPGTEPPPRPTATAAPSGSATPSGSASAGSSAAPTASAMQKPSEVENGPVFGGYLTGGDNAALASASVKLQNDDTKGMLSAVTGADGYFEMPGITQGRHTITVVAEDGTELGEVGLTVVYGDVTELTKGDDEKLYLSIENGEQALYVTLRAEAGKLELLDVSKTKPVPPAAAGPSQTAAPTPTQTAQTTAQPTPQPEEPGGWNPLLIVVIIAAAAVVVLVIVLVRKRNLYK